MTDFGFKTFTTEDIIQRKYENGIFIDTRMRELEKIAHVVKDICDKTGYRAEWTADPVGSLTLDIIGRNIKIKGRELCEKLSSLITLSSLTVTAGGYTGTFEEAAFTVIFGGYVIERGDLY